MLESLTIKMWDRCVKEASRRLRPMWVVPPGIWIVVVVVTVVAARMLWIHASRPPHEQEIIDAYGSVSLFSIFNDGAQLNHDGSQFTYVATSPKGYGLFCSDTATGHKQMLSEIVNQDGPWVYFNLIHIWPWAPDDSAFIYATQGKLFIYETVTQQSSTITNIDTTALSDVVWINPTEFAYVHGGTNIACFQKQPDSQWKSSELLANSRDKVSCLTAIGTGTIAWLQNNFICRTNLADDTSDTNRPSAASAQDEEVAPPTHNLVLWLDAATLQQADKTPVAMLKDLSPSGNNAVAFGNPPSYNASDSPNAMNGKGTIHFASNGSINHATILKTENRLGISGSAPRTVFAVLRPDLGSQIMVSIGDTTGKGKYFGIYDDNETCNLPAGWWWADNPVKHVPGSHWDIFDAVYDGTTQKGYVNGILSGTTAYALNTSDKEVQIGLRPPDSDGNYGIGADGDFAELLVYDMVLTSDERQQVENYLSQKWFGAELLSDKNPLVWFDPQIEGITHFSYSKKTGQFLIHCTKDGRDSLWRFDPTGNKTGKATLIAGGSSIRDSQWLNETLCAYLGPDTGNGGIALSAAGGKTNLLDHCKVDWFKVIPGQNQIIFEGMVSNELSAQIWQYDLDSDRLKTIVPCSEHPSVYAKNIHPIRTTITLPSGRQVDCFVYPPANFNRHKKYPLLLGDTTLRNMMYRNEAPLWAPAIAACGAYVIIIDRPDWFNNIEQWSEDVGSLYERLSRDPCIDTRRVFLFGASAETHYMNDLLTHAPGRWEGVILLNPGELPNFSSAPPLQPRPQILISAGGLEQEEDRFRAYQTNALISGVTMDYIIHPGEGHHLVGNDAELERTKAMANFIFEE